MAVVNICKFNQKGFCKFGDHCRNRHENEICGRDDCSNECELRHPSKCRYFIYNGVCKFAGNCAYLHEDNEEKIRIKNLETKLGETEARIEYLEKVLEEVKRKLSDSASNISTSVEENNVALVSEHKEKIGFNCDICEFKSSRENGLVVHMGMKHKNIEQLDGGLDTSVDEDKRYYNTESYWKTGCLGTIFQDFLDAKEIIEESSLGDIEKEEERAAILAARKEAFGDDFKYYPPWR